MLNHQHQNKESDLGRFELVMVVGLSISETPGLLGVSHTALSMVYT